MIKSLFKRMFNRFGYNITRYSISTSIDLQMLKMLELQDINCIIDIGANTGQFGSHLRRMGYKGKIVSFEPISSAYEILKQKSKDDELWTVAPRMALGDSEGSEVLNIAQNLQSSSFREMLPSHSNAAPESVYVDRERVDVYRLDSVFARFTHPDDKVLLKIDTQGYEDKVLEGAKNTISNVQGVQLELSTCSLYENQENYQYFMDILTKHGLSLWGVESVFVDTSTGRLLQFDAIFFR